MVSTRLCAATQGVALKPHIEHVTGSIHRHLKQKENTMFRHSLLFGVATIIMTLRAWAVDAPVVLNPLRANEGYMFNWIFFAIIIPIPVLLYLDLVRSRRS